MKLWELTSQWEVWREKKSVWVWISRHCLRRSRRSFTTGSVNNMHDTLTPLGGMAPMLHMMLNCVFGGKGVGLMNMVMYVILAVFILWVYVVDIHRAI